MDVGKGLRLVYGCMDEGRVKRVFSFLEGLSLTVTDMGFSGSDELLVTRYIHNDSNFCLTPVEKRVQYEGFENLGRGYQIVFSRMGHEELTDEVFVGFRKDPYTGIFLRVGPV